MGHGIDPRSGPRREGGRSGRRRSSTDLRTLPTVVRQRIEGHCQKVRGGRTCWPEGQATPGGGACVEETVRGTGRTGSP